MITFIQIFSRHYDAFLQGILVSLKLALIIWGTGLLLGITIGVLSAKYSKFVGIPARLFSFLLSGIPVLVYLFWAHYPLQALLGVVIDPFITAAVVLCTVNMFSVSDLMRNQLNDFPEQYIMAAKVCGLSSRTTVMKIQLPIIMRQVIPSLLIQQVVMLHSTLFASLISVDEIFRVAQRVNSVEYKPIHIYSALAFLFLLVSLPTTGLAIWLREKYTRNLSES